MNYTIVGTASINDKLHISYLHTSTIYDIKDAIKQTDDSVNNKRSKTYLAYGKQGITAVTLCALAILQALIIIRSSIRLSLISPQPDWIIYTSSPLTDS